MRFYKRKFILAFVCLLISAALTWMLFDSVEASKETVAVLQVSKRVEKGARITADMLRHAELGAYGLDARALMSDDAVIGKYAAGDLYPGDILTPEKFKGIDEIADSYVQKTRESGLSAVSIQLKGVSAGMSGKLKAGDVVAAYVFVAEGGVGSGRGSVIDYPELQYLEIAAVTNSRAEDIRYEPDRELDYERMKTLGDTAIPATVIFIVDEQQAMRLVEAENTGVVHLVFKGRGEYAQELLRMYQPGAAGGDSIDECAEAMGSVAENKNAVENKGATDSFIINDAVMNGEAAASATVTDETVIYETALEEVFGTGDMNGVDDATNADDMGGIENALGTDVVFGITTELPAISMSDKFLLD